MKKKKNSAIHKKAKECGIHLWQVAKQMGIRDTEFSRMLREELPDDEKEKILQIIINLREANGDEVR